MNELIERLAREADLDSLIAQGWLTQIRDFGQAVALECAEIARTNENPFTAAQAIHERFGLD